MVLAEEETSGWTEDEGMDVEKDWRCMKIDGGSVKGADLRTFFVRGALTRGGLKCSMETTGKQPYVLIREEERELALKMLRGSGCQVVEEKAAGAKDGDGPGKCPQM